MNLKSALLKLTRLRDDLSSPDSFFQEHIGQYTELARETAAQFLKVIPPIFMWEDTDDYQRAVDSLVSRIASLLLSAQETGILIYLRTKDMDSLDLGPIKQDGFTYDEVLDWVNAGFAGDPRGKELTTEDRQKKPEDIAHIVKRALDDGTSDHVINVLPEYLSARAGDYLKSLYPQILTAWITALETRTSTDWHNWVRKKIKKM